MLTAIQLGDRDEKALRWYGLRRGKAREGSERDTTMPQTQVEARSLEGV